MYRRGDVKFPLSYPMKLIHFHMMLLRLQPLLYVSKYLVQS